MPGCAPLEEGTNQQGICPVGVDGTAESSARILMRVTTANATAVRWNPPRDEERPVGPEGEISMAVGPSLGNEVGGSSRDHLTGRCRRLLQRWRLRRCRVHRTRRDRVNEAAIAIERAGVCGELAAVSDRVCPVLRHLEVAGHRSARPMQAESVNAGGRVETGRLPEG